MRRLNVVMVEDDVDLCAGWADVFELIGHDLECFNSGLQALNNEIIMKCDVVISDFYLPDINGVDLIKKMRTVRRDLPAILLTGSRDAGIRNASKEIENCTVLYKPINIEDIESKLADLCKTS